MKILLMMMIGVAAIAPAYSAECVYSNSLRPEETVTFTDRDPLPPTFEITAPYLSQPIKCEEVDNRLSQGPFPAKCDGDDAEFSFFPGPDGDAGATMLLDDEIFYRRCVAN